MTVATSIRMICWSLSLSLLIHGYFLQMWNHIAISVILFCIECINLMKLNYVVKISKIDKKIVFIFFFLIDDACCKSNCVKEVYHHTMNRNLWSLCGNISHTHMLTSLLRYSGPVLFSVCNIHFVHYCLKFNFNKH